MSFSHFLVTVRGNAAGVLALSTNLSEFTGLETCSTGAQETCSCERRSDRIARPNATRTLSSLMS